MRHTTAIIALAFCAALLHRASGAEPFYVGNWQFASAVLAPWADSVLRQPDTAERDALLGRTVAIKPQEIAGPGDVTCQQPKYKLVAYPAEELFEGAFAEMRERDPSIDPRRRAGALGFTGSAFPTLETGCAFDWHFVDPATVEIGLNDWIYTLKKQ